LNIFHRADRKEARKMLGISQDAKMLIFTASGIRKNPWKDYKMIRSAIALSAERLKSKQIIFIALGENAPPERIGRAKILFIPYQKDPKIVAKYYQAADVYIHAARADTFPNTILEALACGTPVVATAVGGIPEQVQDGVTGLLVPKGDIEAMTKAIIILLTNDEFIQKLRYNAIEDAKRRFDLNHQAEEYLRWYKEIISYGG